MKSNNELYQIIGNNLEEQRIEELEKFIRNGKSFFSQIQIELIEKILKQKTFCSVLVPKFEIGIALSLFEKKRIIAFEENSELYQLTKYIRFNGNVDIINENYLDSPINEKFNAIILNCPFGWVRREGKNIRLEKEYINKSLDYLAENGTMVLTVPSNVLTASVFHDIRERILSYYSLEIVINCGRLFNETNLEWYTLVLTNCDQRNSVYFSNLNNNVDEIVNNYNSGTGNFWALSEELHARWDITYMDPQYASLRKEIYNKNTIKLGEIAEIIPGIHIKSEERLEYGDYLILTPRLMENNTISKEESNYLYCSSDLINNQQSQRTVLQENDIVISLIGNIRWYRYTDQSKKIVVSQHLAILRTKSEFSRNLELFFESSTGQEYLNKQTELFSKDGVFNSISISDLSKFVVPDIGVLETASKYQNERNLLKRVAVAFKEAGWEIEEEYYNGHAVFDLALFYNGHLRGAVEVKNYKYDDLIGENLILQQLKKYKKSLGSGSMYIFINEELYVYKNNQLVRLPKIPTPNSENIQRLNSIYIDEEINDNSLMVKQLPDEVISLSDRFLTESLWFQKEVIKRFDRVEGKIDSIHNIVKEIAGQITNYQSLVERQLDRAIETDEIERILQSFTDECTERIANEFNKSYSEHEYLVEENKLKASLGELAWNKLSESSQTFLVSSKLMYNSLILIGSAVDYSGVCLLVTKALEVEMSKRFCRNYIAFLTDKYPGKDNLTLWPTALLNKFGKKIRTKDFTLGSVAYVLCYNNAEDITEDQKSNNKDRLMEYSRSELFLDKYNDEQISRCLVEYAEWIEEVRKDYRNPSAHTNELKKVDAENCFDLVTDVERILKIMLDSFRA